MTLKSGTQLGQYEISSAIGAGGMGEVYKARDHKLARDVALKVLPEAYARDPDRLARFRREARLLASLNHPNIAAIHGLEEANGTPFLVMELVPGDTLQHVITRDGAVPVAEALPIASQIAEALEHAHEKGIIHRDLKPANVKITPEGKVKVLDFGLAKAFAADTKESLPDSNSPTVAPGASPTLPGVILGTAAYMSPEQARGKHVDKRTDIWALGCVLYEMLTGRQVFSGESVSEILGAIHHKEPDWNALPEGTPPAVGALLRRCLRKEAQQRPKDAGDIHIEIEQARAAASASAASSIAAPAPAAAPRRWIMFTALACLVVAVITGIAVWNFRPKSAGSLAVERLVVPLRPNTQLTLNQFEMAGLSPDGTHLVYVATGSGGAQLFLRALDELEANSIASTEGAGSPFFSPDGQWIGFFTPSGLKKVSASGGATLTLSRAGDPRGAAWGPGDTIVFAPTATEPLWQVSAAGGEPHTFSKLQQGEFSHRWPQFLPDGKTVLFTAMTATNPDDALIAVQRLGETEHKILLRGGTYPRYVPTGHIVYYRAGTIMAVPFDPNRLEVKGTPAPVLEAVMSASANSGAAQFSFSERGSLAYVPGGPQSANLTLAWVDRHGAVQPLPAPPHNYRAPRLSPDGRQVSVGIGNDVWIYDIPRDTLTRLTFEGNNASFAAHWTPDGKRVVFTSDRAGPMNLFWKAADGSGPEERLLTSQNQQRGGSFSPDGKTYIYSEVSPKTGYDLWVASLEGDRKPRLFLQTPFDESSAQISPDGRWVAYISNESGRMEVYVRPFPGPGGKWQISTDGGAEVLWSPKGHELFFRTGSGKEKMMAVEVQTQPTFSAGKPQLLFEGAYVANSGAAPMYSVTSDGQRFLMMKPTDQQSTSRTQINVVLNWFEELKRKVPVK